MDHRGNANGLGAADQPRGPERRSRGFCLDRLRVGFPLLRNVFGFSGRLANSYGLKHALEELMPHKYISNGDCILVVLMHGGSVDFGAGGLNGTVGAPSWPALRPEEALARFVEQRCVREEVHPVHTYVPVKKLWEAYTEITDKSRPVKTLRQFKEALRRYPPTRGDTFFVSKGTQLSSAPPFQWNKGSVLLHWRLLSARERQEDAIRM